MKTRTTYWLAVLGIVLAIPLQGELLQTIDFETGDLSQVYQELDGSTASVQASTDVARNGNYSMKAYMTTADRRAEVVNKYVRGTVGGVNWYGWSIYVPANHSGDGRWDIVSQFHDYHHSQPSWSKDGTAPTCILLKGENVNELQLDLKYQSAPQTVAHQYFNLGSYTKGAWHDIVMQVKWTHNSDGLMKVWVNGSQKMDYTGPTYMDYGNGNGPYFKSGNYKGAANWPGSSPRVLYIDEFRMGDANSTFSEVDPAPSGGPPGEVILDNSDSTGVDITGTWTASSWDPGYHETNYLHDGNGGKGTKSVRYTPNLVAGTYMVSVRYSSNNNRASNVPIDVTYAGGNDYISLDQQSGGGQWVVLGTYSFAAGTAGNVLISNADTNGYVIADAVKFTPVSTASEVILDNSDSTGVDITGTWTASSWDPGYHETNYLHDGNGGKGTKSVRYTPNLAAGIYTVSVRYSSSNNRASNVPIDVTYAGGSDYISLDQRSGGGQWVVLGTYSFSAGTAGNVLISTVGTNGYVIADAVKFTP